MKLRCSQLPIVAKCPGMLDTGSYVAVSEENEAANEGTRLHAEIAHWLRTGEEPENPDSTFAMFRRVLEESDYAPRFKLHDVSQSVEDMISCETNGILLTGHPDLYGLAPDLGIDLYDWKTGWNTDADHEAQMRGYAHILCEEYEALGICATIIRRDCTAQQWNWTQDELRDWWDNLIANIEAWNTNPVFNTGEHCRYCPRRFDCPGQRQKLIQAYYAIQPNADFDLSVPSDLVRLWELTGAAEKAAKDIRDQIRQELGRRGPDGITADGKTMFLSTTKKKVVDVVEAWPVLTRELTQEQLVPCLTVGLTRLEEAIKATAPRGQKDARVKEIYKELEAVRGLTYEPGAFRVNVKTVKE